MPEQAGPRRMAVRMINIDFYPLLGGAQMHTLRLSRYLREQGVDVEVITRHHPGLPYRETIEGVPVYRTPILHPSKAGASLSFLLYALRDISAKQGQIQIIHSHEMLSPMTIGLASRLLFGTKLVINPHRGGYLGDVWKMKQRGRAGGKARLALARSRGDAFIAISREIAGELGEIGIPDSKIHRIPVAIDTGHFMPVSSEKRAVLRAKYGLNGVFTACFTGRLEPEKGLDLLIQAWQELSRKYRKPQLFIVGDGSQRAILEAQAAGAGLNDQVHFTGPVADTAPYLQAADLYVQPSFTEGLPVSMLEAMACGLPVLATLVGGVGDLLVDRKNGRTTRPHDVAALLEPLDEMIASPVERARYGAQAREDVAAYCAVEKVGQQILSLYTALLQPEGAIQAAHHQQAGKHA